MGRRGVFEGKALYFCLWWVAGPVFFFFFFSFFPALMNKQNIGFREKLSFCEFTVLYNEAWADQHFNSASYLIESLM